MPYLSAVTSDTSLIAPMLNTFLIIAVSWTARIFLYVLLVKALLKYLNTGKVRKENAEAIKTLGESLKEHRTRCKMTQEFVAEHLGISRQAVSKWESGTSDPSTSNLLALAKLYGVSAEELLKQIQE